MVPTPFVTLIIGSFFGILLFGSALFAQPNQPLMVAAVTDSKTDEAQAPKETLLGFQEWKQLRIAKARQALAEFQRPDSGSPNGAEGKVSVEPPKAGAAPAETQELQAEKLRQLEFNLEIALGLTIHDFFALYLKEKTKAEMTEVVKKLSPEELSELLASYRNSLYGEPLQPSDPPSTLK